MTTDAGRRLRYAAGAAALATLGDLLLLYAVNAPRVELGLPAAPPHALLVGGTLGVVGIPVYWLGYAALAEPLEKRATANALRVFGAVVGAVGALIHALMAFVQGLSDSPPSSPFEALARGGFALSSLWVIASVATIVATAIVARAALGRDAVLPRVLAVVNPIGVTVVLALLGVSSQLGRAFVIPAAPNVAHLVFFAVAAVSLRSSARAGAMSQ